MPIQPSILNLMTSQCRNTYTTHALKIKNTMDKQLESLYFQWKSKENHAIHLIHIIFHTKTKISMNINSFAAKANRFSMVPHKNQAKPWPLTLDTWPWAMAPGHGDISLGHGNESWAAFQNPHCIHGVPCEFHGNHLKINNFTREMKGIKFLPWGSRRHPLDFSCKL